MRDYYQPGKPAPLCDVCQKLDLGKTNSREAAYYEIGNEEDVMQKARTSPRCPFCVAIRFLEKKSGCRYDSGEAFLAWGEEDGGFYARTYGDILAFMNEETTNSPHGSARKVQPYIDPALIKKWIKLCQTHHEGVCTPKESIIRKSEGESGLKVLRVIDVEDWCIVEAMPGVRYLALSYVWGGVVPPVRLQQNNLAELSTKGALRSLREQLPKTITDAIDLVQITGERYLWVDNLCLIQDDWSDMVDGISNMNLVYQCAILTIIAAHGDANTGLVGLHPGSREVDQKIIEVLPGIEVTHVGPVCSALQSTYTSRGWTFQEFALSHRTLLFTENRIYFRCRTNCWSEDTIYDNFPSITKQVLHSGYDIAFLEDNETDVIRTCYYMLADYQSRKLTKESDRINAYTGVLNFLSAQTRSGHLEGLFTASFDISLLTWGRNPPSRREGFPSWSWAGWKGLNDGYGWYYRSPEDANSWLQTNTYIVWYKRSPETAKLELVWDLSSQLKHGEPETHHIGYRPTLRDPYGRTPDRSLENFKTRPDDELDEHRQEILQEEMKKRNYHFLHFFAHVVVVPSIGPESQDTWDERMLLGDNEEELGFIQYPDADPNEIQGPHELVLLSTMDRDRCAEQLKEKQGVGRFSYGVKSERPFYWVMCIAWLGKEKVVAERRGIGYLYQDCIEDLPPPGKVWKEIILV